MYTHRPAIPLITVWPMMPFGASTIISGPKRHNNIVIDGLLILRVVSALE